LSDSAQRENALRTAKSKLDRLTLPRLALRLHLSCYERDLGLTAPPAKRAPRIEGLARALGRRRGRGP
jgi:hypothetical protein